MKKILLISISLLFSISVYTQQKEVVNRDSIIGGYDNKTPISLILPYYRSRVDVDTTQLLYYIRKDTCKKELILSFEVNSEEEYKRVSTFLYSLSNEYYVNWLLRIQDNELHLFYGKCQIFRRLR